MVPYVFVGCLLLALEANGAHFGYTGANGPSTWDGHCRDGIRQSPVDVHLETIVWEKTLPDVTFTNYGQTTGPLFLENDEHSLKVSGFNAWPGNRPYISGGALQGEYDLEQFHLHWGQTDVTGSEHTLGGQHFPAEIHFVHKKRSSPGAPKSNDEFAVLAVFVRIDANSIAFQPLEEAIQKVTDHPGEPVPLLTAFNLKDFLPKITNAFFTYPGSLTTPACDETVVWTVFIDPVSITSQQLNLIRETKLEEIHVRGENVRPIQPLNDRKIRFRPVLNDDLLNKNLLKPFW